MNGELKLVASPFSSAEAIPRRYWWLKRLSLAYVALVLGTSTSSIGATEEVAMALEILYGVTTGVRLESLYRLSKLVEEVFQIPIEKNKAIVGENIVRHQIDSHLNTLIRGIWWAWESMRPEFFGRKRSLEWAKGKLRTGRSGSINAQSQMWVSRSRFIRDRSTRRPRVGPSGHPPRARVRA